MVKRTCPNALVRLLVLPLVLFGGVAVAQDEPPPAPPPAPPPVQPGLTADRKDEDLKPTPKPEAPKAPVLKVGVGLRTGVAVSFNNPSDETLVYLDDGLVDQANLRPYMTADLTENISFFSSYEIGTTRGLGFSILDAVVQLKIRPEFQVWVGQHIAANDRNNMNGPFFGNGWNFAIAVPSYPFDVGARDRGVTFWGLIAGGRVKYHASIVDLQPGGNMQRGQSFENARYGGRVTVHLWEPEDFYYNSGTYFGKKDVLAIGAVVNYQKGVDTMMPGVKNDFLGYSFDALMEKNLGTAGTYTLELGYWDFTNVDPGYVSNQGTKDTGLGVVGPFPGRSFMASASWLSPNKFGAGYLQPNARWQYGDYDSMTDKLNVIDVGLGYIIDGFNNRWYVNYRHVDGVVDDDLLQLGIQIMM